MNGYELPGIGGPCTTLTVSVQTESNFSCYFIFNNDMQRNETTGNLTRISVSSVVVATPFKVVGYPGVLLFPCATCGVFGVAFEAPATGGTYQLDATVVFSHFP